MKLRSNLEFLRFFAGVRTLAIALSTFIACSAADSLRAASKPPDPNPTIKLQQFALGRPIRMVAYGDMRFTDPAVTAGTNPRVRKWLAARIAEEHPQTLLLTGDMPFTGASAADWEEFQAETAAWRGEKIVQLPTPGNHEIRGGAEQGIANYLRNFPLIAGHRFYSALLGDVEVISLDCTLPGLATDLQRRWFGAQLDHLPRQVDFLLILYHVPWMADAQTRLLVNVPTKEALMLRGILEARLDRIRARVVVFNGHIHNYERFERNGVEYVVSGGGGAEPYPLVLRGESDLYRDTAFPVYHYLTIEIGDHKLHAVMWKVADPEAATLTVEAKDEFTLAAQPASPRRKSTSKPDRK